MIRPISKTLCAAAAIALLRGPAAALAQETPAPGAMAMVPLSAPAFVKKWDHSGKGLLSLGAIDNAAIVKLELLDTGHVGQLTIDSFGGSMSQADFDAANPDGDTTIGVDEYLDLVKHRFARANTDHDGTLDLKELQAPAGEELLKLVG